MSAFVKLHRIQLEISRKMQHQGIWQGKCACWSPVCQYAKEQVLGKPSSSIMVEHIHRRLWSIMLDYVLVASVAWYALFSPPWVPRTWYHTISTILFCRRFRTSHQLPWVIRLSQHCLVWAWTMYYVMCTIQSSRLLIFGMRWWVPEALAKVSSLSFQESGLALWSPGKPPIIEAFSSWSWIWLWHWSYWYRLGRHR